MMEILTRRGGVTKRLIFSPDILLLLNIVLSLANEDKYKMTGVEIYFNTPVTRRKRRRE